MHPRNPTSLRTLRGLAALTALATGCGGAAESAASSESSAVMSDGSNGAGGAAINVYLESSPIITAMTGLEEYRVGAGEVAGVEARIAVVAVDPDGDDLTYTWSTPDCASAELSFPEPADMTQVVVHVEGSATDCVIQVEVRDFWKDQAPPAGSGLPAARGGLAVGRLRLSSPPPSIAVGT
jgi:hypothetical protein